MDEAGVRRDLATPERLADPSAAQFDVVAHARPAAPVIVRPFGRALQRDIARHVGEVRRCFDWPGIPYHDATFNRWMWHNLPLLQMVHHGPALARLLRKICPTTHLKPSYSFLSMYGRDGICPEHTDRPQCALTVDYLARSDADQKPWPIFIDGQEVLLQPGEAVVYSGTDAPHWRPCLNKSSDATYADLVFFHFVRTDFFGPLA